MPTVTLFLSALINAPLVAIQPNTPDAQLHAVTMEGIGAVIDEWAAGGTLVTACGITGVKLVPIRGTADPVPWPPQDRGAPIRRCHACWVATGKKRPRSKFMAAP